MRAEDRIRLQHMLDAAREAIHAVRQRTRRDLERDHVWALGLVKCLEIIGEAASRVSRQTQEGAPAVPWAEVVAMRNRLVHAYFDVDLDQVWLAVTQDLPALVAELSRVLSAERAT